MKVAQRTLAIVTLSTACLAGTLLYAPPTSAKLKIFDAPIEAMERILDIASPWKNHKQLTSTETLTFGNALDSKIHNFSKGKLKLIDEESPSWRYLRSLKTEKNPQIDVSYALSAIGLSDKDAEDSFKVHVKKYGNEKQEIIEATFNADEKTISLPLKRSFKPGRYTATVESINPSTGLTYSFEQDFVWGVLAMNTDKDRYRPKEEAHIAFGVLDEMGRIVCNSELTLTVTSPAGEVKTLSTENDGITTTNTCGKMEPGLITPDYEAFFTFKKNGTYQLELEAETYNGIWTISSSVEVTNSPPIIIKREAATRLWPFAPSSMKIEVEFFEDYEGEITDVVPSEFKIIDISANGKRSTLNVERIVWYGSWKKGQTAQFSYQYDAPNISPEFYLIGPLELDNKKELRTWQIANDAITADNLILHLDAADINGDSVLNSGDICSNGSTTWTDASVSSNDATLSTFSAPCIGTSGWDGDGTTSDPYRLEFDGGTDNVFTGYVTAPKSISTWFRIDVMPTSPDYILYWAGDGSNVYFLLYVYDGLLFAQTQAGYGQVLVTGATGISTGIWHHFTYVN
ncbi:hypothetical protein KKF55_01865, partial [Patescibacteria group bacterium]|nr:hypothetical protein [Patescibacteria group bacterium]